MILLFLLEAVGLMLLAEHVVARKNIGLSTGPLEYLYGLAVCAVVAHWLWWLSEHP